MLDCFVYIRQDATQSYLEVLFYSIGAFNELQECSLLVNHGISVDECTVTKESLEDYFNEKMRGGIVNA